MSGQSESLDYFMRSHQLLYFLRVRDARRNCNEITDTFPFVIADRAWCTKNARDKKMPRGIERNILSDIRRAFR